MWFVPKCYKRDNLGAGVSWVRSVKRRLGGGWYEMTASLGASQSVSQSVSEEKTRSLI
jgi:hypothetical protein